MKVLLVNPNTFTSPPVPPLALEYLEAALDSASHEVRLLDLTFEPEPESALSQTLEEFQPAVAGFTVRNVDTVIYRGNEFFLPRIRLLVDIPRRAGVITVLGGAGFSLFGEAALDYLGADYGIVGPGGPALNTLLDSLVGGRQPEGRLVDGWRHGIDPALRPNRRGAGVDYPAYLSRGALAGFETTLGCLGGCPYCPEAGKPLLHRQPGTVVEELAGLAGRGVREFHLCDSEFNQDLRYCRLFLETLIEARLNLRWALYLKSEPYDPPLFELLAASGAWLVTLSLPTGGPAWADNAAGIAALCREHGIRLAVDFLCGLPDDTPESIRRDLDSLRRIGPDSVGLNSVIRLYPGCPTTERIMSDPASRQHLRGPVEDNPGFLVPAFYHRIGPEELKEIAGDDPLFRIEGFETGSNYQRV